MHINQYVHMFSFSSMLIHFVDSFNDTPSQVGFWDPETCGPTTWCRCRQAELMGYLAESDIRCVAKHCSHLLLEIVWAFPTFPHNFYVSVSLCCVTFLYILGLKLKVQWAPFMSVPMSEAWASSTPKEQQGFEISFSAWSMIWLLETWPPNIPLIVSRIADKSC